MGGKWSGWEVEWSFTFHLGHPEIGNPKVWPTNQFTGVGSRDTCVSKKVLKYGKVKVFKLELHKNVLSMETN